MDKESRGIEIHIQRDGQQMGPYTLEQINEYLVQGALLATDSAWHEGLPQWVPLNEIAGVVSDQAATSTPPPFKPPATMAPKKTRAKNREMHGTTRGHGLKLDDKPFQIRCRGGMELSQPAINTEY